MHLFTEKQKRKKPSKTPSTPHGEKPTGLALLLLKNTDSGGLNMKSHCYFNPFIIRFVLRQNPAIRERLLTYKGRGVQLN